MTCQDALHAYIRHTMSLWEVIKEESFLTLFSWPRSRWLRESTNQISPPRKDGRAPQPVESRKSNHSVNPYCVRTWWVFPCYMCARKNCSEPGSPLKHHRRSKCDASTRGKTRPTDGTTRESPSSTITHGTRSNKARHESGLFPWRCVIHHKHKPETHWFPQWKGSECPPHNDVQRENCQSKKNPTQ